MARADDKKKISSPHDSPAEALEEGKTLGCHLYTILANKQSSTFLTRIFKCQIFEWKIIASLRKKHV